MIKRGFSRINLSAIIRDKTGRPYQLSLIAWIEAQVEKVNPPTRYYRFVITVLFSVSFFMRVDRGSLNKVLP